MNSSVLKKYRLSINQVCIANTNHLIQKNFSGFDKIELYFTNQTTSKYWIKINKTKINLNIGQSRIIDVKPCEIIHIKSNNFYARPIVFAEKNSFIDCFHA